MIRIYKILFFLFLSFLVFYYTSCTPTHHAAPVEWGNNAVYARPSRILIPQNETAPAYASATVPHSILSPEQQDDTYIPTPVHHDDAIAPASKIEAEQPEQRQRPSRITVRKGDTVYALARRHGVTGKDLIRENNLRPPYALSVGQKLRLPLRAVHVVKRGDNLYGISRQKGVSVHELASINGLRPPYALKIGQTLKLPGALASDDDVPVRRASVDPMASVPRHEPFVWPAQGQLVSTFGMKSNGIQNDGINIALDRGSTIRAARSGRVIYAGDQIGSYGNLVLIQHPDNYVTAYAHADRILVNKGDDVQQGDRIATVGSTGAVTTPQLHFEIRRGKRPIDPLDYLRL